MPIGCLLILVCDIQQFRFIEIIADDLQADRTLCVFVALAKSAWNRHAGQAREAGRQREDIGQIIGERIIRLRAQIPGHGR